MNYINLSEKEKQIYKEAFLKGVLAAKIMMVETVSTLNKADWIFDKVKKQLEEENNGKI